jgi:hypothetical protein
MVGDQPDHVEPTTEPVAGDAFGQLLLAQYAELQEPQFELVERDDGFLGVTEARAYFSQREQLGPLEAEACQEATGRVLDVGCGAGRHSLVMMARGLPVTGLEPSPGAAEVARVRGVTVIDGRLDQMSGGQYDTIVMLGNNLSLLAAPAWPEISLFDWLTARHPVPSSWGRRSTRTPLPTRSISPTTSGIVTGTVAVASCGSGYGFAIWPPSGSTTGSSQWMNSRESSSRRGGLSRMLPVPGPAIWPD